MGLKARTLGSKDWVTFAEVVPQPDRDDFIEGGVGDRAFAKAQKHSADLVEQFEAEDAAIEFRMVASDVLDGWVQAGVNMAAENAKEVAALRKGLNKDLAPELYENKLAPSATKRLREYVRGVLGDCGVQVRGFDKPVPKPAELVDFDLGLAKLLVEAIIKRHQLGPARGRSQVGCNSQPEGRAPGPSSPRLTAG
ncbi:MAG: hypothetical protein AAF851_05680 [Myxococcota bacterium]